MTTVKAARAVPRVRGWRGRGFSLTVRRNQAVALYVEGHGEAAIAKHLHAGINTVTQWLQHPDAQREIAEAAVARRAALHAQLVSAARRVLVSLVQIAEDEKQPGDVRVRAAETVLDRAGIVVQPSASQLEGLQAFLSVSTGAWRAPPSEVIEHPEIPNGTRTEDENGDVGLQQVVPPE